jgi:pyruvate formate lyase activating enzyme
MIGGIQKTTLIDYPGKTACVIFVAGCNFRCPFCHNPELVAEAPANEVPQGEALAFLEQRRDFLDGVVISGGEPTLQPGLAVLCETIKNLGYRLKLDTNGSRPEVLKELIGCGLVDYVAMDLKTDGPRYRRLTAEFAAPIRVAASASAILASGIPHEFRTTCVGSLVDDRAIAAILEIVQGADLYVLQRVVARKVLDPGFFAAEDRRVPDGDLLRWRHTAERRVGRCIIR